MRMSFYSYKNANADASPGMVTGNVCTGLNEKICIQVKNVYDSCLQQEQLDDVSLTVANIVPIMPDLTCKNGGTRSCACSNNSACSLTCTCGGCTSDMFTHQDAVESAQNSPNPLPTPFGQWTFESCRSATTCGVIRNLSIDRLCDRPQFARVKCNVDIPIDVLFTDDRCQEWMGTSVVTITKDVLLAIPEESIVPFTLESMVSAICVTGDYIGNCRFEITICITVVLKILAEVEVMVPTYGFCQIPPCEEFAENVCDEFFALPLFPTKGLIPCIPGNGNANTLACPPPPGASGSSGAVLGVTNFGFTATCSNCGTTMGSSGSSLCPRCGCAMTRA